MSAFTQTELDYLLGERRLARVATVGDDGTPHVVPVGWSLNRDEGVIEVSGRDFADTKKFRDVAATRRHCPRPGRSRNRRPRRTDPNPPRPGRLLGAAVMEGQAPTGQPSARLLAPGTPRRLRPDVGRQ